MAGFFLSLVISASSLNTDGRCDLVEVNHYAPDGGNGFTQVIAWDWCPQYNRWHCQQWAIVEDWSRAGGVVRFVGDGVERTIGSRLFRETWTATDPERENQRLFPTDLRRKVW